MLASAASRRPMRKLICTGPPGASVRGNWVTNRDVGNNEIYFVTDLSRNGRLDDKPAYTTEDADATAPDDCEPGIEPPH